MMVTYMENRENMETLEIFFLLGNIKKKSKNFEDFFTLFSKRILWFSFLFFFTNEEYVPCIKCIKNTSWILFSFYST